jgi:hypothetical protein
MTNLSINPGRCPGLILSQAYGLNAHGSGSQHEFSSRETVEAVGNDKCFSEVRLHTGGPGKPFFNGFSLAGSNGLINPPLISLDCCS